jgi:SAM-dependent methyltransferase
MTNELACCGLCGRRAGAVFVARDRISERRFDVACCAGCGLWFTSPKLSRVELDDYYTAADAPGWTQRHVGRWLRQWRARWCADGLRPGRALDVGCGNGEMLLALGRMGWDVVGTERVEASALPARRMGLEIHAADLEVCRLAPASFDLIILWHVLEHLSEPLATLDEVARLLRPDGRLVVAVPNIASWQARLAGSAWYHLDVPRHLYHLDRRTLALLLRRAGFGVERVARADLAYDVRGWWEWWCTGAWRNHAAAFAALGVAPVSLVASLTGLWPDASATVIVRATLR